MLCLTAAPDAAGQLLPVRELKPSALQVCVPLPAWGIRAGARETIYYNPSETNVAIVTCGGLCPGLNDVVQGLVRKLEDYGVPEGNILGIRCMTIHWRTPAQIKPLTQSSLACVCGAAHDRELPCRCYSPDMTRPGWGSGCIA